MTVIAVTNGEAAYSHIDDLAKVRTDEQERALETLGLARECIVRLNLPDGKVGLNEKVLERVLDQYAVPGSLLVAPGNLTFIMITRSAGELPVEGGCV